MNKKAASQLEKLKRELEVEKSLEKIRDLTMKMNKSEELAKVIQVVFQEAISLGFGAKACDLVIFDKKTEGAEFWISGDLNEEVIYARIPRLKIKHYENSINAWKKGKKLRSVELKGRSCKAYMRQIIEKMEDSNMPEGIKKLLLNLDSIYHTEAFTKHGLFRVASNGPLMSEEEAILKRFAKVFEQTYTRFLDLEKAEAQAREARIEVALERIRAASMAMQKSEELPQVALTVLNQIEVLGISHISCDINIVDNDSKDFISYSAHSIGMKNKKVMDQLPQLNLNDIGFMRKALKNVDKWGPYYTIELRGKFLNEMMELWETSNFSGINNQYIRNNPDVIYLNWANFNGLSSISLSSIDPLTDEQLSILVRMAKTFALSYTRFLDLQKAEAQAREAEIEAALERVRASSMAMHKSEELVEVATVLHNELRSLNVREFSQTSIVVHDEPSQKLIVWGARTGSGSLEKAVFPLLGDHILQKLYDVWRQQKEFFTLKIEGAALQKHIEFVLPKASRTVQEDAAMKSMPDPTFFHCAFYCMGYLELMADKDLSEDSSSLLVRFAKVFDQAYRRFLDLQKAEAQAREAQIEVALEKVRSRSLAMQNSDELQEVVKVLRKQLTELGLESDATQIELLNESKDSIVVWVANEYDPYKRKYKLEPLGHNMLLECINARNKGKSEFSGTYTKGQKNKYYREAFKKTDLKNLPEERKEEMLAGSGLGFYAAWAQKTGLHLLNFSGYEYNNKERSVLRRFSEVFDQVYTRFLDLQKAEAQTREAEIQLALERVRARTMGMQHSDELQEVINRLFHEFQGLQINIDTSFILTDYDPDKTLGLDVWVANSEGSYAQQVWVPYLENNPPQVKFYEALWSGQEFYSGQFTKKEKNTYFRYAFKHSPQLGDLSDERKNLILEGSGWIWSAIIFKNVVLCIQRYNTTPFSDEESHLLRRFGEELNQTYTRFLDLQKAESQAREAQIEASLEKVRGTSMAMHKSEDLIHVANVMNQEFEKLGFTNSLQASFVLIDEEKKVQYLWGAQTDSQLLEFVTLPLFGDDVLQERYEAWKRKEAVLSVALKGEKRKMHVEVAMPLDSLNERQKIGREAIPNPFHICCGFNKYGYLTIISSDVLADDQQRILARMAKVFEQTYTRFLDLQKAEAQAREAQIEAALERIRASALAMHNSEDLVSVADTLKEQMGLLGQHHLESAVIELYDLHEYFIESWHSIVPAATKDGKKLTGKEIFRKDSCALIEDMILMYKSPQKDYTIVSQGEKQKEFIKVLSGQMPEVAKVKMPDLMYYSCSDFTGGTLLVATLEEPSDETKELLSRASKVFDLAYQRFMDLQKAESQAREAQIEASLERVRASSMAMHTTEELWEVSSVVYEELNKLGITEFESCGVHIVDEEKEIQQIYNFHLDSNQLTRFQAPLKGDKVMNERYAAWKHQEKIIYQTIGGKALNDHLEFASPQGLELGSSSSWTEKFGFPDPTHFHFGNFSKGYLHIIAAEELPEEHKSILGRFARVFEQAYIRFLDLQKAEKQAREAQIEVSLERVRARAMAMHKSGELIETAILLSSELSKLGIPSFSTGFVLVDEVNSRQEVWFEQKGIGYMDPFFLPLMGDPVLNKRFQNWKNKIPVYSETVSGKRLNNHLEFVAPFFGTGEAEERAKGFPDTVTFYCSPFPQGYLHLISEELLTKEHEQIFLRFSKVFAQTYTRFLDLKKAEAQAREAEIEAALERIRSRALAMHSSEEFVEVVNVLREQMETLDQPGLQSSVIHIYPDNSETFQSYYAFGDQTKSEKLKIGTAEVRYDTSRLTKKWVKHYNSDINEYTIEAKGKELSEWLEMRNRIEPRMRKTLKSHPKVQYYHFSDFSGGSLITVSSSVPSEDIKSLQKRTASVFDLAYKRYIDLQAAEQREKEAIKQSSLDRVRAEIASMRTTDDLNRITPLVWRELTTLGVPFFRCGIFIVDDTTKKINVYLSNPDGESLAAWSSGFDTTPLFKATYEYWKKQKVYRTEWDKIQFKEFTQTLIDQGLIDNPKKYQAGKQAPNYLALQMVPFKQGMLYVGSAEKLKEDQIELAKTLAESFSVAYARYEDFRELEEAKGRVENTLSELKSAQTQLIQSEKMASLGELTAGIAHEIQNPLNFVNNFSDINKELADEVLEEIRNGNMAEAEAILSDIINNDTKILHHGKRAEEIVRSMLLHSRGSSGEREMTDINTLADEYMRLAYHGMRAKDKSFNADFELKLDKTVPRLNVIPQDIGRVLLNLVNNAFHATTSKATSIKNPEFKPFVTISTKNEDGKVKISVKDNGQGIPDSIKDKIFQPFFTTKATGQGTGLGLSLSYDIVTKGHGGSIEATSKEGEGTEFIISIPTKS